MINFRNPCNCGADPILVKRTVTGDILTLHGECPACKEKFLDVFKIEYVQRELLRNGYSVVIDKQTDR